MGPGLHLLVERLRKLCLHPKHYHRPHDPTAALSLSLRKCHRSLIEALSGPLFRALSRRNWSVDPGWYCTSTLHPCLLICLITRRKSRASAGSTVLQARSGLGLRTFCPPGVGGRRSWSPRHNGWWMPSGLGDLGSHQCKRTGLVRSGGRCDDHWGFARRNGRDSGVCD